jgi:NAD(P)-dependent dehydrogenase (short-subunit alcohol dehydrogenase family)
MTGMLEGKVGVITGGAIGIGRATALMFAREGARVVVADIMEKEGAETAELIVNEGGKALFVPCDVTQSVQVEALIRKTVETYGRVDCAFNNAGVEGEIAPTAEYLEENWDRVVAVNLKGVWLCMKYEMQQMLKQGKGVIVNTASVAGVVAERGFPAYAAAKGGVIQLTRTAAVEYAGAGIRINAVSPGVIMTPMMERALKELNVDAMMPGAVKSGIMKRIVNGMIHTRMAQKQMMKFMQPMGHPGKPEEIAGAVVFLCSDAASFITGHNLLVDGGMTAA